VDIKFYSTVLLYTILLFCMNCLKGRKAILFWRVSVFCSLAGIAVFIVWEDFSELGLAVALLTNCIMFSFMSQNNMCPVCGRCYYGSSLFSNKCRHCKNKP
jgi:ribosomal protein L40E